MLLRKHFGTNSTADHQRDGSAVDDGKENSARAQRDQNGADEARPAFENEPNDDGRDGALTDVRDEEHSFNENIVY